LSTGQTASALNETPRFFSLSIFRSRLRSNSPADGKKQTLVADNYRITMVQQGITLASAELPHTRPTTIPDEVDPAKNGQYDATETTKYLLQQLPTAELEPRLLFSREEWTRELKSSFLECLPMPTVGQRNLQLAPEAGGLTHVLSWTVEDKARHNGAQVHHDEFGYDENGYICNLGAEVGDKAQIEIKEHIVSACVVLFPTLACEMSLIWSYFPNTYCSLRQVTTRHRLLFPGQDSASAVNGENLNPPQVY
jgi:hypothetical protein